jgi:predicted CoA-binding protein
MDAGLCPILNRPIPATHTQVEPFLDFNLVPGRLRHIVAATANPGPAVVGGCASGRFCGSSGSGRETLSTMSKPTVAIVGASADRAKFSNKSILAHLRAGYKVYPVNPKEDTIEGLECYKSVLDIPGALDRVSLYVPPSVGVNMLDDIARKGCQELWVNPGAESPELIEKTRALGLNAIFACSYADASARA